MMTSQASRNYAGRSIDLCYIPKLETLSRSRVQLAFGNDPTVCTGVEKLVQWVVNILMTIRGSDPYRPDYGTLFMEELSTGQAVTDDEAMAAFGEATLYILEYFAENVLQNDTPADEVLKDLGGYIIEYDGYTMKMAIEISTNEDDLTVIVPIPLVIK